MKIRVINSYDVSEINEAVSFHNAAYGDKRTSKQWIWEYKSNYPDLFVFTIIKDDGRIVGTQGMIPIYLNIGGKRYLSGKSENTLLDPKYRGKSFFQKLYEFAMSLCERKNMYCVWGYTSVIAAKKGLRNKLRFSVYENTLYESILILNIQNILSEIFKSKQTVIKKIAKFTLIMFCYFYSLFRFSLLKFLKKSLKVKYSIEHRLRSINDLDLLYGRLREKYPDLIHIDQDKKYIMWRVYNNPNIKYKTYFVYEDTLLRGYCYVSKNNKKTAFLADFTFEGAQAGAFLLQSLLDKWRKEKTGFVFFLGNAKNPLMVTVFNLLGEFGFLKTRSSLAFVLKNISYKDENHLYDIKNWYTNGLWTEGYTF